MRPKDSATRVSRTETEAAIELPAANEDKAPRPRERRCQRREIGVAVNQERRAMCRRDAPTISSFDADLR